jgi:hypothetical protein|nr:MAG TPA: hypothetical protein [Caudoviricetes sp.]
MSLSEVSANNRGMQFNKNKYTVNVNGIALFNNSDGSYKSGLGFSMWNGLLKIYIIPFNEGEGRFVFNSLGNNACIFLNQTKAFLFSSILKRFKEDREKYNGYGINAGKSIITINNGTTFNKSIDETAIRIVKFNEDTIVDNEGAYQLKTDYYNYINNVVTEKNTINFNKVNSPELKNAELDLIINQLDEFVKATTNAYAYATSQTVEYNFRTLQDNLNELLSR